MGRAMIRVLAEIFGLMVAATIGIVCMREMSASGPRADLCLLAVLAVAYALFVLRRAWRFAREVRDVVDLGDH